MRLGKIKCAAKVGRLMGGFAALFILRRDSQTALPKIALSVGFCLAVRVALSDRVADNVRHICEGTAFENRQPNIFTNVDSRTNAQ